MQTNSTAPRAPATPRRTRDMPYAGAGRIDVFEVCGGRHLLPRDRHDGDQRLDRTCGAQHVPVHRLRRTHGEPLGARSEHGAQCIDLDRVAFDRPGAVRVDVVELVRGDPAIRQRLAQCLRLSGSERLRQVMMVTARAIAGKLGIDSGAALLRTLVRLEHQRGTAFSEHQPGAITIERPASRGRRRWVGMRKDAHRVPCEQHAGRQRRFGAAGDDDIGLAGADQSQRLTERDRRRGAGHRTCGRRAGEAETHRDVRCGGVVHAEHDEQRRCAAAASLQNVEVGLFDRSGAAQAGAPANGAARPLRRGRLAWKSGIAPGSERGGDAELSVPVRQACGGSTECGFSIEVIAIHGRHRRAEQ